MKLLLVTLILLVSVTYKSISQNVILNESVAISVVKDLERKDFLEKENQMLKLQIVEFKSSLYESRQIEANLKAINDNKDKAILYHLETNASLKQATIDLNKELKKSNRKSKIFMGISLVTVILSLIIAVK